MDFLRRMKKKVRYQRDGIFRGIKMVKALFLFCLIFLQRVCVCVKRSNGVSVCAFARKIAGVRESGNKIFYIKLWMKVSLLLQDIGALICKLPRENMAFDGRIYFYDLFVT